MNARKRVMILMTPWVMLIVMVVFLSSCGSSGETPPQQLSPAKNDKDVRLIKVHVNGHTEMFCVVYRPSGSISCQWP